MRGSDIFNAMDIWADNIFGGPGPREVGPRTNVTKTEKGVEVSLVVPGVNKEDIDVNIDNNTMTVSYKTSDQTRASFATKSFSKSWRLPEDTDPEFITAKSENGILTLSVPYSQTSNISRTISIQ